MNLLDSYFRELKEGKISLTKSESFFNGAFSEKRDVNIPLTPTWVEGYKRALLEEIESAKPIFASSFPLNERNNAVLLPQDTDATYSDMVRLRNGDFFVSSLDEELVKFTNNFKSMIRYGYYDASMSTSKSYSKVKSVAVNPSETQIALTMGDTIQKIKIYSLPTFEFIREVIDTEPLVGVAFNTDDELYYATKNKVVYDYMNTTTSSREKVTVLEYGLNGFPSNLGVEDVKKIKVHDGDLWVSDSRDRLSVFNHVIGVNGEHKVRFTGRIYTLLSKLFLDGQADILDFNIVDDVLYLLCEQDKRIYKVDTETHSILNEFGRVAYLNYADSLDSIEPNIWHNPISFYIEEDDIIMLDIGANAFLKGVLSNTKTLNYKLEVPYEQVVAISEVVEVSSEDSTLVSLKVPLGSEPKKLCYSYEKQKKDIMPICQ